MSISPEFQAVLADHNPQYATSENDRVNSFGNPSLELKAAEESYAVLILPELIRIRISGRDRAKFLHNFCTNDVNGLTAGEVVEAFLTNVKARILGHGYIASFDEHLELWMLPGDSESVVAHLQKYIIVEDVAVQLVHNSSAIAVAGPQAPEFANKVCEGKTLAANQCQQSESCTQICVEWADNPMLFISVNEEQTLPETWQNFTRNGAIPAGHTAFEAIRIAERFPRIGVDLSEVHMAPEADRNPTAICYTKGCYLGQEPIARLDAMGHVNRQLCRGTLTASQVSETNEKTPVVTSQAALSDDRRLGLAVLPAKAVAAGDPVQCQDAEGQSVDFKSF